MSNLRRPARIGFAIVTWLFVACAVIAIYLASVGVFGDPRMFAMHREFGYLFGALTLVMLVLAVAGRMSMLFIGGSIVLVFLFGTQSLFVWIWREVPAIAALHPLNGVLILAVATYLGWRALPAVREPRAT